MGFRTCTFIALVIIVLATQSTIYGMESEYSVHSLSKSGYSFGARNYSPDQSHSTSACSSPRVSTSSRSEGFSSPSGYLVSLHRYMLPPRSSSTLSSDSSTLETRCDQCGETFVRCMDPICDHPSWDEEWNKIFYATLCCWCCRSYDKYNTQNSRDCAATTGCFLCSGSASFLGILCIACLIKNVM